MKRSKYLASALSAFVFAGPALACSCVFPSSADEQLENSGLVFIGTVIDTGPRVDIRPWYAWMTPWHEKTQSPWDAERVTTFQVDRMLKGPATKDVITFVHRVSSPTCGVRYSLQQSGVFIGYEKSDGLYGTSLCISARFTEEEFIAAAERVED